MTRSRTCKRALAGVAALASLCFGWLTSGSAHAQSSSALPDDWSHGDGVEVLSEGEDFRLRATERVQALGVLGVADDELDTELMIRRARTSLTGHIFAEHIRFKLEFAYSPRDLGYSDEEGITRTPFLDYYVDFRQFRDFNFRIGQYKLPITRERVISSGSQQMVDRSIVNRELTADRNLGFDLRSSDFLGLGMLRYHLGLASGEGRDGGIGDRPGFLYFARVEVLPLGMFDDYREADLARSPQPRLSLGASYAFMDDAPFDRGTIGDRPEDGGTTDYHLGAADLFFVWAGFSLQTELVWRAGQREPGRVEDSAITAPRNGLGWFIQAGYLVPEIDLEVSTRFALNRAVGDDTSMPDRSELGLALSYYFAGHPLKIQVDVFHLWEGSGSFASGDQRIRLQLQASL